MSELRFEPVDASRSRPVPVKVYLSQGEDPLPVILFSHGLGGSRENNAYLGSYWAAAGYSAVFMQHPGSDEDVWKSAVAGRRFSALKAAASALSSRERFADVPFVIDQLEAWNRQTGHELHGRLNLERIGMSGHSYGAVTTLALAGQKYAFNRTYSDPRIGAFLAMSPQPGRLPDTQAVFGHLTQPILCMTGTKDGSPIDPTLKPSDRRTVYTALPAGDKYQLVLKDAEHMAFGDSRLGNRQRNPKHHTAIQQISLTFWNAYLKDDLAAKRQLQSAQLITDVGLDTADVWEWK
ncbi:MAG: dienelactone hydrolase [Planctomycetaceae bacterium]|nr:dienelactone hydrolase [Planctomycetaceae bacterium]